VVRDDPYVAAERIDRRTQRILWGSGLAFLVWQIAYFVMYRDPSLSMRNVDMVRSAGFIGWCAALLGLVAGGGGTFSGQAVRAILDDELAKARRADAYRNAFWTMLLIAFVGYVLAHFTRISSLHLAHAGISAGILVAVVTLAWSGRR
jgi:hypothetical protein